MASNVGYDAQYQREMRIVLLGKTGQGKSALGNLLCGSEKKKSPFSTGASSSSVTNKSQCAYRLFGDRGLCIIDTPGLFDTNCSNNDETMKEIARGFLLASPGPHAFLIVLYGRCTQEEETVLALLQRQFGPQVADYCIVVVTHEDEVRGHDYQSSDSEIIRKYSENAPESLKNLMEKCNNRCILINNRADLNERERKVEVLVDMIKQIEHNHGNNYYNHQMFAQAERELHQWENDEIERQRQEHQRKREQMREEIRKENLPREEEIEREEKFNDDLRQEEQRLKDEIRDLRRYYLQNDQTCQRIVRILTVISKLLPPPVIHFRSKR